MLAQLYFPDFVEMRGASQGERRHEAEAFVLRHLPEPVGTYLVELPSQEVVQENIVAKHLVEQELGISRKLFEVPAVHIDEE